jgi:hypothetical protein
MQFVALIYDNETEWTTRSDEWKAKDFQEWMDYTKMLQDEKVYVGGEALLPTNAATSVRMRDNKVVATDGPFAETKEQLGGYYVFECKDIEEAIHYASQMPAAREGTIEVRPVMVIDQ